MKKLFLFWLMCLFITATSAFGQLSLVEDKNGTRVAPYKLIHNCVQTFRGGVATLNCDTISSYTIGTLPTASLNTIAVITDGTSTSDCTTGGGSEVVLCRKGATTWSPLGDGYVKKASDCSGYITLGQFCQDTDDKKLYLGNGAAAVEIAAGATGDVTAASVTQTWGDGAEATVTWTFDVSGTDTTFTPGNGVFDFSHSLNIAAGKTYNIDGSPHTHSIYPPSAAAEQTWGDGTGPHVWTFSVADTDPTLTFTNGLVTVGGNLALGTNNLTMTGSLAATGNRVTKGWFTDIESTYYPTVGGAAVFDQAVKTTSSPTFAVGTFTGASSLVLGTASTNAGSIILHNATNANHFTITSGVSTDALAWTLPTSAPGGSNYLLNVDADGTMGYTDPSTLGITTIIGTDTFWAAKGDLAVGTANNTAAVLTVGAEGTLLGVSSGTPAYLTSVNVEITGFSTTAGTVAVSDSLGKLVDSTNVVLGDGYIALGANPADAGAIRLSNATYIMAEADAAGTDISVIGVDSSEVIQIGASGASGVTITPATTFASDVHIAAAGVKITAADGEITFTSLGNGSTEDLSINLNDTANTAVVSSSTGVTTMLFRGVALDGLIPFTLATDTVTIADTAAGGPMSGIYFNNADSARTFNLPATPTGKAFCFRNLYAKAITIDPNGTDIIVFGATTGGAGKALVSDGAAGEFMCLVGIDASTWVSMGFDAAASWALEE